MPWREGNRPGGFHRKLERGFLEGVIFEQGLNGYIGVRQWSKEDVLIFKNVR